MCGGRSVIRSMTWRIYGINSASSPAVTLTLAHCQSQEELRKGGQDVVERCHVTLRTFHVGYSSTTRLVPRLRGLGMRLGLYSL